jgi:uncharacterized protein (DUF885 family)
MSRVRLMVLIGFALTGAACVAEAPTRSGATLRALFDEEWSYWMAAAPEAATAFGVRGHDDRWSDYSRDAIASRAARLRDTQARFGAIDRAGLSDADRLNLELFERMTRAAIEGLSFDNDPFPIPGVVQHNLAMPVNQMEGIHQDVPRIISLMPAATVEDYERILTRLRALPAVIDQHIALMREGLARGLTPPRITMRDVPGQVAGQIVDAAADSPLLAAFREFPASVGAGDRERLRQQAAEAYASHVRPAWTRLHAFLVDTYLPACRETIGVTSLPNGAAMYAYNVRWHTTSNANPEQIHELGKSEVARIRREMDAVIAQVGFTGGFEAFKTHLRTSPRFFFRTADELEAEYHVIAKRADPALARLFGVLPRTPYGIERIPDAVAPSQTTAYYEPGALTAGRPGNMFVNTYKLDARPSWEMAALTLHEAVPGHHLQIALAQELEDVPDFRRNMSFTAFVEGWALYAESLGDEMGLYRDPYSKFGQLTYEMWRAVRLVVDTGIHAMGWTRQQAIDFFLEHTAKTAQDIGVEVDRYIVWPGQALGYKWGQLRMQAIRREAAERLGATFDVRKFHDRLLGQGALPMDLLEARMTSWNGQ